MTQATPAPFLARLRAHVVSRRGFEDLVASVLSAAFALRFGFSYGTDNQTSYLLGALRRFDPELLRNDWLAAETTPYHPAFQFIGWILFALDDSGWSFAVANSLTITAGGLLLYWIGRHFIPSRYVLLAYILCMALLMITETDSIAITYFFEYILQPSNLGTLGWLLAIGFLLGGRWLAAGIALALGGLMHANFLLLAFPAFGLTHLLLGQRQLGRRLVRTLGPPALVLPLFLPQLLGNLTSETATMARDILFHIRSPHHYWPMVFQKDFVPFASWQALGLGLGLPFLRRRSTPGHRLAAFVLALVLLVWLATALTTVVFIPQVSQLFVWRLAPFSDVLLQFLACAGLARLLLRPVGWRQYSLVAATTAVSGAGLLMTYHGLTQQPLVPRWMLAVLLGLIAMQGLALLGRRVAGRTRWERRSRLSRQATSVVVLVLAAVLYAGFALEPVRGFRNRSNLIQGLETAEHTLFTWVRTQTPPDAVFLVPPDLERFRLHARRAIVVDWKSPPLVPDELLEWYRRLCHVSGNPTVSSLNAAMAGYRRLDIERLQALVREYGVSYVVIPEPVPASLRDLRRLYSNGKYTVLQVPG